MDDTTTRHISLLDSLGQRSSFRVPFSAMRETGQASMTLAAIRRITDRETFQEARKIAVEARVSLRTFRRHLETLESHGWLENRGRKRTRAGRPRRTSTIVLTGRYKAEFVPFGIIPWWMVKANIVGVGTPPWTARAVLSVVLNRLNTLVAVAKREDIHDEDEILGYIENLGDEDRFRFPLRKLERETGLTRGSVVEGKRWLYRHKLIRWSGGEGGSDEPDILYPNWSFRVEEEPAGPGKCYLRFMQLKGV